jgi:hypothetical protein
VEREVNVNIPYGKRLGKDLETRTVAHHSAFRGFLYNTQIWPSCEVVEVKRGAVLCAMKNWG